MIYHHLVIGIVLTLFIRGGLELGRYIEEQLMYRNLKGTTHTKDGKEL